MASSSKFSINADSVINHVQQIIKKVYTTHTPALLEREGIKVFLTKPSLIDHHTISLNNQIITARKMLIATGSSPAIPPIQGLEKVSYHTNTTIFSIKKIPKTLAVIGAGPVGIELAQAFQRLGVQVTLIEMSDRILAHEDEELTQLLTQMLQEEGIKILTSTQVSGVLQSDNLIHLSCKDSQITYTAQALLIAVGRRPNAEELNLTGIGVKFDKHGIKVDHRLRTTKKNIFAAGDVIGPYQFSHMAEYQALIATQNALVPIFKKSVNYDNTIWVTFCAPELARIGLTELQARQQYGDNIRIYRADYGSIDRPVVDVNHRGMAKIICYKGKVVGAHILGSHAGEIIHEIQVVKHFNRGLAQLNAIIHAYPTYADVIKKVARICYVDQLQRNIFIRLLGKFGRKKS